MGLLVLRGWGWCPLVGLREEIWVQGVVWGPLASLRERFGSFSAEEGVWGPLVRLMREIGIPWG